MSNLIKLHGVGPDNMHYSHNYFVIPITYEDTKDLILNVHYARRMPSVSYAFGLYRGMEGLQGICTFGSPASPWLCKGVCGEEHKSKVHSSFIDVFICICFSYVLQTASLSFLLILVLYDLIAFFLTPQLNILLIFQFG